jgi:hypothetical protein
VKLVQLDEGDNVTAVARVVPEEEGEGEADEAAATAPDDDVGPVQQ